MRRERPRPIFRTGGYLQESAEWPAQLCHFASRTNAPTAGRQYVRQPWRCHRRTVSGFTTRRDVCQRLNQRYAKIKILKCRPHPQGADVACGAAGPIAVAGGKDCLRSAAPLVEQLPQPPTANSEALPFPLLLNRQEADGSMPSMGMALTDHNFAPFRSWRGLD